MSILFFPHTLGMWRFLGQGLELCHSSTPSYCSDNTRYLSCCATRERPMRVFFCCVFFHSILFYDQTMLFHIAVVHSFSLPHSISICKNMSQFIYSVVVGYFGLIPVKADFEQCSQYNHSYTHFLIYMCIYFFRAYI